MMEKASPHPADALGRRLEAIGVFAGAYIALGISASLVKVWLDVKFGNDYVAFVGPLFAMYCACAWMGRDGHPVRLKDQMFVGAGGFLASSMFLGFAAVARDGDVALRELPMIPAIGAVASLRSIPFLIAGAWLYPRNCPTPDRRNKEAC